MTALLLAGGSRYREAVLNDAPALYCRLAETSGTSARDLSGNGNHGTYVNTPGLGAGSLIGADGNAACSFTSGSSHDCTFPGPSLTTNGTIEAWFTLTSGITLLRDDTNGAGWFLGLFSGTNLAARAAGTNVSTSVTVASLGSTRHHLVLTKSGGSLVLYLDGTSVGTASGAGNTASVNPWHVARNGNVVGQYSSLTADEIAIYTTALTATQVANHWKAGR